MFSKMEKEQTSDYALQMINSASDVGNQKFIRKQASKLKYNFRTNTI